MKKLIAILLFTGATTASASFVPGPYQIRQDTVLGATVTFNGAQPVTMTQGTVIGATVTFNGAQQILVVGTPTVSVINSTVPIVNGIVPPVVGIINSATSIISSSFTPVYSNAAFTIWPGTATGVSVIFEASADSGTTFQSIGATQDNNNQQGNTYTVSTATTTWDAEIAGMTNFRIRATGWTTGFSSVTILISAMPTVPITNVTGSTVSLTPISIVALTTGTFTGTGYPPIGVATELKVTSTTIPTVTNDGNPVAHAGTNIGQALVTGIPYGVILSTYTLGISSSQTGAGAGDTGSGSHGEVVLVSSGGTTNGFTYLCGCVFISTGSATANGGIFLQSPAGSTTNVMPFPLTATTTPTIWPGCMNPFYRSQWNSNIYIYQNVFVGNEAVYGRCQYYQGP